jgi:pimeloyl-ACP methyl ester carboxylesterase
MWHDHYISRLPAKYHAYAMDMRGHGQSNQIKHGCNLVQLADDIYQFSQQLQLAPFLYVGVSMGGGVGIQLALDHPEVLKGLVLMNTVTGFGLLAPPLYMALFRLMIRKRWLLKMMLKSAFKRPPSDDTIQLFLNEALFVSKETVTEWMHPNNRMQHFERLSRVNVPTLVIIGDKDTVIPVDGQHRLADTLPNAKKVVFEGEGHMMGVEIPEDVFTAMNAFLQELS